MASLVHHNYNNSCLQGSTLLSETRKNLRPETSPTIFTETLGSKKNDNSAGNLKDKNIVKVTSKIYAYEGNIKDLKDEDLVVEDDNVIRTIVKLPPPPDFNNLKDFVEIDYAKKLLVIADSLGPMNQDTTDMFNFNLSSAALITLQKENEKGYSAENKLSAWIVGLIVIIAVSATVLSGGWAAIPIVGYIMGSVLYGTKRFAQMSYLKFLSDAITNNKELIGAELNKRVRNNENPYDLSTLESLISSVRESNPKTWQEQNPLKSLLPPENELE